MLHATHLIGFGAGGAVAPHPVNAVSFDGSTIWLDRGADLTGNANSKLYTGSLWFLRNNNTSLEILLGASGNYGVEILNSGILRIIGRNTAAAINLSIQSSTGFDDNAWHHALWSVDMADTGKRHLYIDDSSDLTVNTYVDQVIDFTDADHFVANNTGAAEYAGDLAEVWLDFGNYLDLSQTANRRKFIRSNGKPEDLGSDGSTPTGTAPIIYFTGDTSTWHTNSGTGGGYTENGTLTTASTSPSD